MPDNNTKKVLIIGTTGAVGMAARDMCHDYIPGAEILTYDTPPRGDAETAQKERAARIEKYQQIVSVQNETLDGSQAHWLLRDKHEVPASERKEIAPVDTIEQGVENGVDAIVITLGKPRQKGMQRSDLLADNAHIYEKLGTQLAQSFGQQMKTNPHFKIPVMIVVGNPVDTTTEVLWRTLSRNLAEQSRQASVKVDKPEASANGDEALSKRLDEAVKELKKKVIGQGGVLDGARGATAISQAMAIPLNDVVAVPVEGQHGPNMAANAADAQVMLNGKQIPLSQHPEYTTEKAAIIKTETTEGGKAVIDDYREVIKHDQSAVLAAGAATMRMVDAVLNNTQEQMPVVIYHTPEHRRTAFKPIPAPEAASLEELENHRNAELQRASGKEDGNPLHGLGVLHGRGYAMGAMVTLGADGATFSENHVAQGAYAGALAQAADVVRKEFDTGETPHMAEVQRRRKEAAEYANLVGLS